MYKRQAFTFTFKGPLKLSAREPIVINEQPDRCRTTRPTAAAAAVRDQPAEALPLQKAKMDISTNGKTDTPSISVRGKIQTTNVDCPTTSSHQNASKVLPQQRKLHLNLADIETSTSTEPAVPDRPTTTTPMGKNKNKEITASLASHQTKVHPHRLSLIHI